MKSLGYCLLALALTSHAGAREWTDTTGQFRVQGELISVNDAKIRVRTPDGKILGCQLEQLSVDDQVYVKQIHATAPAGPRFADAVATPARAQQVLTAQSQASTVTPLDAPRLASTRALVSSVSQQDSAAASWPLKYVYTGHRGTFHLFIDKTPPGTQPGSGTANYHFQAWYLAKLTQVGTDTSYYYYAPQGGDPFIKQWAFSRYPDPCDHCYTVWYGLGTPDPKTFDWHIFEKDQRYRPW
jgi:SLA1 Homology Domain 1 (SHD1) protein